ncbi:AMP-binding protein [Spirillospora sp. CA-255316]
MLSPPPLTPLTWLDRAAVVYADRIAVAPGVTWRAFAASCRRGSGVLAGLGIGPGDRVGVLAPNSPLLLEAQYAIPGAGGIIVNLNPRLSAGELAYIIGHSEMSLLLVGPGLESLAREAVAGTSCAVLPAEPYESLRSSADELRVPVTDELSVIALNYTSGTTGRPKGVMATHRGVFLQALAMALHLDLNGRSTYLWTLPLFHANGWCFAWAVAAVGCRNVLLARPDPVATWEALRAYDVTHLCAAPTVLNALLAHRGAVPGPVTVAVGGSPPSPALIGRLRALRWRVFHLYGLTETSGPAVICEPQPHWDELSDTELAAVLARQGVPNVVTTGVSVVDSTHGPLPPGDPRIAEIRITGNTLFGGYYKDPSATGAALAGGSFRTGDLGVVHADGYVELIDRDKDIIISGGENIASVEVERVLDAHPGVLESAVVAAPHDHWGEIPVAVVTLRPDASVTEEQLIAYVKERMARFKAPRRVVFRPLPKSETGKILKFALRDELRGESADD